MYFILFIQNVIRDMRYNIKLWFTASRAQLLINIIERSQDLQTLCINSACVCRLNREEGDGAWCPEGQLEPSDSQYLQVCVCSGKQSQTCSVMYPSTCRD